MLGTFFHMLSEGEEAMGGVLGCLDESSDVSLPVMGSVRVSKLSARRFRG